MRQINFFSVIFPDDLDRLFDDGHHAKTQQIDFYNSEVGTIFFIPLHDDPTRHRRRFERHD